MNSNNSSKQIYPNPPLHYKQISSNLKEPDKSIFNQIDTLNIFGKSISIRRINDYEINDITGNHDVQEREKLLQKIKTKILKYDNFNKVSKQENNKNINNKNDIELLKHLILNTKSQFIEFINNIHNNLDSCGNTLIDLKLSLETINFIIYNLKKKTNIN